MDGQTKQEREYNDRVRANMLINDQIGRIVQAVLESLKRVRHIAFCSTQEPFRHIVRTSCAGCVQSVRATLPKVGTLKCVIESAQQKPLTIDGEQLRYKEFEADYALFENYQNKNITRAIVYQTQNYLVYLFVVKTTSPVKFSELFAVSRDILAQYGLDNIQLIDKPHLGPSPIVDLQDDASFIYHGVSLHYALRQTKRQPGQPIVLSVLSTLMPNWEWRVQELVIMQTKIPQVYFLTTIVEMKPEAYDALCKQSYWLNKLNLLWYSKLHNQRVNQLVQSFNYCYNWINPDLTDRLVDVDLDALYTELVEQYFKASDPDAVEADTIFQQLGSDKVVYYGIVADIQSKRAPERPPTPKQEAPVQRKSRFDFLAGNPEEKILDSDEEEESTPAIASGSEGSSGGNDDDERPPTEEELREKYLNTKIVCMVSAKFTGFRELVETLILCRKMYLNCEVYICIQNTNQLTYGQYQNRLPGLDANLNVIWDLQNFYFKIAGQRTLDIQVFDRNNKLLKTYESGDGLRDLIERRETKKLRERRERLFARTPGRQHGGNQPPGSEKAPGPAVLAYQQAAAAVESPIVSLDSDSDNSAGTSSEKAEKRKKKKTKRAPAYEVALEAAQQAVDEPGQTDNTVVRQYELVAQNHDASDDEQACPSRKKVKRHRKASARPEDEEQKSDPQAPAQEDHHELHRRRKKRDNETQDKSDTEVEP